MRHLAIALVFLMSSTANAVELQQGQVWAYKTRPGESASTLTVLRVERYKDLGSVVHVRIDGIQMTNPLKGNVITDIPHLPFKNAAVQQSITKLVRSSASLPDFQEGYDTWRKAYLSGEAGAFDASVANTLDAMLGAKWEVKK